MLKSASRGGGLPGPGGWCLLPGGGLPGPGGGGWCLLPGGGVCSWGGLLPGGSALRGVGVVVPGLGGGVSAPGGPGPGDGGGVPGPWVCLVWGGYIPACTEADTPPPVDRQTPVKILPWPNFVAAGNNE